MVKHDTGYSYARPGRFQRYSDIIFPIAVFIGAMALYLKTMAPSIFWNDTAAFASSNFVLGLPHSPSFPLYTLLGRVFNLLPNLSPAAASNVMSVFFAALSVTMFYLFMRAMADVPVIMTNRKKATLADRPIILSRSEAEEEIRLRQVQTISKPAIVILPCLAGTALFAISLPVWLSAVRAEVYSLQLFLTLMASFAAIRGMTDSNKKLFYLGIWIYALSFANHPLLSLAFAPAFLYLFFANLSSLGRKSTAVSLVVLFFMAAFSVYFYLPIRSAQDPAVNWGRPDNLEAFIAAITRSADMSNLSQITFAPDYLLRLQKLGQYLAGQIGWPLIGLTLIGFVGLFKISRRLFLYFPLAFLGSLGVVLWAADFNPRNYDLVNYLAPLTAIVLIISVAGTLYILRTKIVAGQAATFLTVLIGAFIYLGGENNVTRADLSRVQAPGILCREIMRDLPEDALLIVAEDDVLLPLWYAAFVDSTASKINIVSAGAMLNPHYRKQLTEQYPSLVYPTGFTGTAAMKAESLAVALCRLNAPRRAVYIQYGVPGVTAAMVEPSGIVFKFVGEAQKNTVSGENLQPHLQFAEELLAGNPDETQTIEFTGRWLFNTGVYYDQVGHPELSWKLINRALETDKESVDMRVRLAAGLAKGGRLKEALQYISQALEIDPNDRLSLELGHQIVQAIEKKGTVAAND